MIIRKARSSDYETISLFLRDIAELHRKGRPDIFKKDARKFSEKEFLDMLEDETKPVFVAGDDDADSKKIYAHAFCQIREHPERSVAYKRRSLFLDDLYVDPSVRGSGVGGMIIDFLKSYGRSTGCYNLELNVWEFNQGAITFYEKQGMHTQSRQMEIILNGDIG